MDQGQRALRLRMPARPVNPMPRLDVAHDPAVAHVGDDVLDDLPPVAEVDRAGERDPLLAQDLPGELEADRHRRDPLEEGADLAAAAHDVRRTGGSLWRYSTQSASSAQNASQHDVLASNAAR